MAYKYSTGSLRQGDIYYEDDRLGQPTYIDFGMDTISLRPSGSAILNVSASAVGIGTTAPDYTLDVAGNIGLDEYLYHNGDDNTYIRFQNDDINMQVGGTSMIKLDKGNNVVKINNANQDIDFKIKDNNSDVLFHADAGDAQIGIGTDSPISKLDVAGKIAITAEVATPSAPADGKGWLYTKTDGKIYWQSADVAETDLTSGGSGGGGISFNGSTANGVVTYGSSTTADVESNLTFNGSVLTVAGYVTSSTGYQGFLTDADNDTYITVEAADDEDKVRIFTGGNQRMMLRNSDEAVAISDNNVGDFTPLALLHVSGAGSGGDQLFIVGGGSADKPNALVVDQNGQVGVGDFTGNAANPLLSLSVSGTFGVYKTAATTTDVAEARFILDSNRGSGHDTTWKVGSHYHSDSLHKFRIAESNTNILQIIEGASANSLYIDEESNVGLGTSSPTHRLTVGGTLSGSGQTTLGNNLLMSGDQYVGGALNVSGAVTLGTLTSGSAAGPSSFLAVDTNGVIKLDEPTVTAALPDKHVQGLGITYIDDDNIQIGTGECRNIANDADMTLSVAQNVDITAAGINGLDTGTVADATWYSIWLVSGASGTGGLYSTSTDSPTLPAGYDVSKRRIGWIRTYQTAIPVFVQTGGGRERTCYWGEASGFYNLHTNLQDTTGWQTDYSMAAGTAPTAHTMLVTMQASAGGTNPINWRWQGYADMGAGFTISQLAQTILEYDTMVRVPCIDNSGVNMNIRIKTWSSAKAAIRTAGWIETI